jgi:hypothetical protein
MEQSQSIYDPRAIQEAKSAVPQRADFSRTCRYARSVAQPDIHAIRLLAEPAHWTPSGGPSIQTRN